MTFTLDTTLGTLLDDPKAKQFWINIYRVSPPIR
jgi:hypothetical protein